MLRGKCQLWLPSSPSPQPHYKIFVYRCALFLSCKPISQGQRREAGSVTTSTVLYYNNTMHSDLSGMMVSLSQFIGTSHTTHDEPDFHLGFPKITHCKTSFDEGSSRHNLARTEPNSSYEEFRIALPKVRLSNGTPKNLSSSKASFSKKSGILEPLPISQIHWNKDNAAAWSVRTNPEAYIKSQVEAH